MNNPSIYPLLGSVGSAFGGTAPTVPDPQENRPPRINQWSAGFQREITKSFIMEASYVGNHAVWLEPFGGNLGFLSQQSPQRLAHYGLYPIPGTGPAGTNNENARALLADPSELSWLCSSSCPPRESATFIRTQDSPRTRSLQAALYPYPQYGAIEPASAPTGDSMYNSLQMKATKRLSHGFQAGGSFTWASSVSARSGPAGLT